MRIIKKRKSIRMEISGRERGERVKGQNEWRKERGQRRDREGQWGEERADGGTVGRTGRQMRKESKGESNRREIDGRWRSEGRRLGEQESEQ